MLDCPVSKTRAFYIQARLICVCKGCRLLVWRQVLDWHFLAATRVKPMRFHHLAPCCAIVLLLSVLASAASAQQATGIFQSGSDLVIDLPANGRLLISNVDILDQIARLQSAFDQYKVESARNISILKASFDQYKTEASRNNSDFQSGLANLQISFDKYKAESASNISALTTSFEVYKIDSARNISALQATDGQRAFRDKRNRYGQSDGDLKRHQRYQDLWRLWTRLLKQ